MTPKTSVEEKDAILDAVNNLSSKLINAGLRVECDLRHHISVGWRYNHWELKGVPVRLEIGPKDLAKNQVLAALRFSGEKRSLSLTDVLPDQIKELLNEIHNAMYKKYFF